MRRQKRQFKDQDEEVDYQLNRLVRAIKLSKEADGTLAQSYNRKIKSFSESKEIFSYITIIIDMNSNNPEAVPAKEKKFFLNFITGIVDQNNHVEREYKTIDDWEGEDWEESAVSIRAIQDKLKLCKLGTFITELLK